MDQHLESVVASAPKALEDVGMPEVAALLRKVSAKLDSPWSLRRLVAVLDPLDVKLVEAYARATDFTERASSEVREDAVRYQQDLLTARCAVVAARETAKHALRGDTALN